jgi:LysR family positive regulator for ilvC
VDTRSLSVFLSVCASLNFSRSAEQQNLSVSAVSRCIQRLEEELGQTLLERDRRSMRLTSSGEALRVHAEQVLQNWEGLRARLSGARELQGEVSVFCSVTASFSVLSPVLEQFRSAHPQVDIMLHTGDQADGIGRVLEGRDDLAVTGRPRALSPRQDFLTLTESPMCLCIPAGDGAVRRALDIPGIRSGEANWERLPFVVPERGVTRDMIDAWFAACDIRAPTLYAQVAGHEAIVAMVALGLGIGFAPEVVVRTSGYQQSVEVLPLQTPLPNLQIGLCSLHRRLQSPLVRAFWQEAARTYSVPL